MATLEQKIIEAHERQIRTFIEENSKMVRVTLLEPYTDWRTGSHEVCMRFGSTEAREMGERRDDDEVIDLTQRPRRIIPGTPVHYHLSFEEQKDRRCVCQDDPFDFGPTIVMPLPVAGNWFGHWTQFNRILGAGEIADTEYTVAWQKKRVAQLWGGYKKRPRTLANYTPDDWRTLESTGAPAMPKVRIVRLDTTFREIPNSEFLPWDVYQWDKDVVADRWSENPDERVLTFTEKQLREFIASEVAKGSGKVKVA